MESTLSETKANLQLALEEMETTNEELQSSNEELMSANEELQSGNEELQSLNEELHTLNAEHQQKIRELVELNEDLDNYFRSTNIGQIFIDANLLIRKFNPAALSMVNLIESDVGRPINHISNNINYPDLNNDIHSVLASNTVIEKEIGLNNGSSHLMRVMPYLKHGGKIDGVVISFIDITTITKLNNMVSGVFNASASGIMAFQEVYLKPNQPAIYRCIAYNEAAGALFHGSDVELQDQPLLSALPQFTELNLAENIEKILINDQPYQTELQLVQPKWHYVIIGKMAGGFVISLTDITKRKVAEQKLKGNYNELIRTRESLRLLNQDLETKVAERTKALSESEERFKFVSEATNDTIWDWNLVTNDMWRSDNFKTMFGYELNARTNTINFWLDCIHPDDRQRVESSVFQAIDNGEDRWSSEYRFKKADENYAMILDRASILKDQTDMPHRLVGSVIDITRLNDAEKKLSSSERKFAKVFDSNMIGMLFSTFEGKINEANDAFLKMLGYVRKDLEDGILDWKN
ncbi:MAG: PAS domain-containing protein, partial [Mucilaginibacter sp.]|nr:PAS domain-containing protein [Mucilaginibacter sp.]